MSKMLIDRRKMLCLSAAGVALLSGCAGAATEWRTDYEPVTELAKNWRLSGIRVSVPESLTISEANDVYVPKADIVWQEEKPGDRRAQVRKIVSEGIEKGARGLKGSQAVRFDVQVQTFHALNKKSLYSAPESTGVENIKYLLRVIDARTGAVVVPPQEIRSEFPGLTRNAYTARLVQGETQRDRIVNYIAQTTAGWLGTGPDNRRSFTRLGG